jgi:hypothetical protein
MEVLDFFLIKNLIFFEESVISITLKTVGIPKLNFPNESLITKFSGFLKTCFIFYFFNQLFAVSIPLCVGKFRP